MSLYVENIDRWKLLSEVDYFTQFVKAWVCFNAWYKTSFPDLKTDKEAIDHLKATNNKVRDGILSHLNNDYADDKKFKIFVGELHHALERKPIRNKGSQITFQEICIEENFNRKQETSYNKIIYRVEREVVLTAGGKGIESTILNSKGIAQFNHQQAKYNFNEIELLPAFLALGSDRQSRLRSAYEEINLHKPICLIAKHDSSDKLEIGGVSFVNDKDKICKGIITALYAIRNVLFHGEIVPDKETNRAYEPAFQIMKMIIDAL